MLWKKSHELRSEIADEVGIDYNPGEDGSDKFDEAQLRQLYAALYDDVEKAPEGKRALVQVMAERLGKPEKGSSVRDSGGANLSKPGVYAAYRELFSPLDVLDANAEGETTP